MVEVSVDGGISWEEANLVRRETGGRFAPVRWAITTPVGPGRILIMARAHDSSGDVQPLQPRWNLNGYGNNLVHRVAVTIN